MTAENEVNNQNVIRSTAVVSLGTAFSRILGLARLMLMASFFGTSLVQSAFVVAWRIPNLFRRLFGEGALSAAFVPVFSEALVKEGREKAWGFAVAVMTLLGCVLAGIVIVVLGATSLCMKSAAFGGTAAMVLPLLRIMFPYMFFICMVAFCMAVLNSFRHFAVPAFTPVLFNVLWILTLVFVCPRFGDSPEERIYGVAWGILVAGVVQLVVQFPVLVRFGYRPRLSFDWRDPRIKRVLLLMGPAALAMGVVQINVLIDTVLAFFVGTWAPAALLFADTMVYLPLGIFATALGTVLLPTFSSQAAQADPEGMKRTLNLSIRQLMLVMVPAATGLVVLAHPIIRLLFQSGLFNANSTTQTARALIFYAPGLVVFGLYKVLVPVFYAKQDTRTPVRVAVWAVALNLVLNITFIVTWPREFKHAGLAFATVISSGFSCVMLGWLLHRRMGSLGWGRILGSVARVLVISAVMGATVFLVNRILEGVLSGIRPTKIGQLVTVVADVAVGMTVYVALAALLCKAEMKEIIAAFRQPVA